MLPEFKNLKELIQRFSDDKVCREYLEEQLWHGTPICPHCGCTKTYRIENGKRLKCANNKCYQKFSVTVGTIFENSNVPLNTWFAAIYLATAHKKGISSCQLSRDLGITQKTAWFMLHRIREAFKLKAPHLLEDVVQADETYVGGKNKNRHSDKKIPESQGRSSKDKTPVLGMMQYNGIVNTCVVPNTKAETIKPLIEQKVKEGSILITDEWQAYKSLDKDYLHIVVKHNEGEYVNGAFHTNSVEGFWSLLKRGIFGIYHQVSPKHLDRYCDEFGYRYNSRDIMDNERFKLSLSHVQGRLTYKQLIGK